MVTECNIYMLGSSIWSILKLCSSFSHLSPICLFLISIKQLQLLHFCHLHGSTVNVEQAFFITHSLWARDIFINVFFSFLPWELLGTVFSCLCSQGFKSSARCFITVVLNKYFLNKLTIEEEKKMWMQGRIWSQETRDLELLAQEWELFNELFHEFYLTWICHSLILSFSIY